MFQRMGGSFIAATLCVSCAGAPKGPVGASASPELSASVPSATLVAHSGLAAVPAEGVRLRSEYSRIVVRETGTVRTLAFVDEHGKEHIESRMDVAAPERLLLPYSQAMFVSYLFTPRPERVLLIGVGAGSMIRFLERYDAAVHVDAVDIDQTVLDVARDYFGTRESEHVKLIAADGFDFVERAEAVYDVIYLDAFLKPMPAAGEEVDIALDVDASGVPRRLKTIETYRKMQTKLRPGGVVVVNLHYHTLDEDVATLRRAFGRGHLFDVPGTGNFILVGTPSDEAVSPETLYLRGKDVDARLRADFSVARFAGQLRPETSAKK